MSPITIETSGYSLDDAQFGKLALKIQAQDPVASANTTIVATFDEVKTMAADIRKLAHIQYTRDFQAPIEKGEVMGTLTWYPEDGGEGLVYDLVAARSVNRRDNAPKTLAQIVDEVNSDPNPLPPLTLENLIVYLLLPILLIVLVLRFIRRHLLKRRRMRRMSRLRRPRHLHR